MTTWHGISQMLLHFFPVCRRDIYSGPSERRRLRSTGARRAGPDAPGCPHHTQLQADSVLLQRRQRLIVKEEAQVGRRLHINLLLIIIKQAEQRTQKGRQTAVGGHIVLVVCVA